MARCATYRLRKGKDEAVVNQSDYHADLARWEGWKRVGETHVPDEGAVVETGGDGAEDTEAETEATPTASTKGPVKTKG